MRQKEPPRERGWCQCRPQFSQCDRVAGVRDWIKSQEGGARPSHRSEVEARAGQHVGLSKCSAKVHRVSAVE